MKKKVAIIGANEFQNRLIVKAKELGYETHVFAWASGDEGEINADYFYPISIVEYEDIYCKCVQINIDAICSIASDLANITVHLVAEKLGLIANNLNCLDVTTNKLSMRQKLHGKCPIPWFQNIYGLNDVVVNSINYPVIVKPIDRSGSRGVSLVGVAGEMDKAIKNSLLHSFTDNILIESFVDGNEYSVESISQHGIHKILQVTEKLTTGAPNFIEVAHIAPASLTSEKVIEIENVVISALNTLGIKFGAGHTEVKITNSGDISIIEVGSRMGGDFIGSDLVQMNTGYDYLKSILDVALNININILDIDIKVKTEYHSLVLFYFSQSDYLKAKSILDLDGSVVRDERLNPNFSGNVESSADRFGYTIFKFPNKHLSKVLEIIR